MINQEKPSPEADEQGVCHTEAECNQLYENLSAELKTPALKMLAEELKAARAEIQNAYTKDPEGWYTGYHFGWGMAVRNLLRKRGFGEAYFGIHNLDDIYGALVVEALDLKG